MGEHERGGFIHLWREQLKPLSPASGEEALFIHERQVDILYRSFAPAALGTVLMASLFVIALWEIAASQVLLGWLLSVYGVTAFRAYIARQYRTRHTGLAQDHRYWESRFAFGALLAGASWGAVAFLFTPGDDSAAAMMVVFTIAGISAAGGALLASSPRAVLSFLLAALVPLSIEMFSCGDRFHLFMGTAVIIYLTVLLVAVARRQNLLLQSMLTAMENERLKGTMAAEKMLAEERERTAVRIARLETESQYNGIFHAITDGLILFDVVDGRGFRPVGANPALARIMGWAEERLTALNLQHCLPPAFIEDILPDLRRSLETGAPVQCELVLNQQAGPRILESVIIPIRDHAGGIHRMASISRDITERKQMETLLYEREQAFRNLVETSPDVIVRYDRQCRRVFVNSAHAKATGRKAVLGTTPQGDWMLPTDGEEAARHQAMVLSIIERAQPAEWELTWKDASGQTVCYLVRGVPECDRNGKVVGVLTFARDISERLRFEDEIQRQASYDALTGLPNRRLFNDRLREEIARASRHSRQMALLFIDLDRFKEVNDTLGHESGDHLLKVTAQRIQSCMRESDTVARLGGDEFVAILSDVPDVSVLGRVAQQIIAEVTRPFTLAGGEACISASIGIAGFPMDANQPDELLASADHAMYAAKGKGRNTFCFFTPAMQQKAQSRANLFRDLRLALSEGQLEVHYQPIISMPTGVIVKAAAVLRWRHPELGWVSPEDFIPIAEESGVIHDIGTWAFRQAVVMALDWRWLESRNNPDAPSCQISIPVSPRQFAQDKFDEAWVGYLHAMKVDPGSLVLEITEGLLLNDHIDVAGKLRNFQHAGMQVALEDFGLGHSTMVCLKKYDIDYLKINRSVLRDFHHDPNDRAIVEAIIAMSHRLGLRTIAEGVEAIGQQVTLSEAGCEFAQGDFYSRPLPAEMFLEFVRTHAGDGCKPGAADMGEELN